MFLLKNLARKGLSGKTCYFQILKPWDMVSELSDCSEVWQSAWQHHRQKACQISKTYDDFNRQSCDYNT